MPSQSRVFDASTIMAIQAWEIVESIGRRASDAVRKVQRDLLAFSDSIPITTPSEFTQRIASQFRPAVASLWQGLSSDYQKFAAATSSAMPRFLGRAVPSPSTRSERIIDVLRGDGPYDPDEVERDDKSDDAVFLLLWLLLSEFDLLLLLQQLTLYGQSLDLQWSIFSQQQALQLLTRLNSAAAGALNDLSLDEAGTSTAPERAIRQAVTAELRRNIAGGPDPLRQKSLITSTAGIVQTQAWAVFNAVVSKSARRNPWLFAGEMWTAILDERTCARCFHLNGRVFPFRPNGDSSAPDVPLHPYCRCHLVPVLSSTAEAISPDFGEWFVSLPRSSRKRMAGSLGDEAFPSFRMFLAATPRQSRNLPV